MHGSTCRTFLYDIKLLVALKLNNLDRLAFKVRIFISGTLALIISLTISEKNGYLKKDCVEPILKDSCDIYSVI